MCRFTGQKHRYYSPSRSTKLSYWRRLPTIYEATDVEMAEENETGQREEKRCNTEAEQLGVNGLLPLLKKNKRSKPRRQGNARSIAPSLIKTDFTEADSSRSYQQIQDEWSYLLRTPYADFFPETTNPSFLDSCFLLSSKKTQAKLESTNNQTQYKLSELSAWLEFFG